MKDRILVIDDDELVRKTIDAVLKRADFKPTLVSSGNDAITAIQSGSFDLVLSDIRMPGKDGVETVREIQNLVKKNSPREIPVVFITGYAELSRQLHAEGLGEVILKPFDLDHLLITIREYL